MDMDTLFQRLVKDNCAPDTVIDFKWRVPTKDKNQSTGRYITVRGENPRIVVTLAPNDPIQNISTILHEIGHHNVRVANPYAQSHGNQYWRTYWALLIKYEGKIPGLYANAIWRYGWKWGTAMQVALSLDIPGAREKYNELCYKVQIRNEDIQRSNQKIRERRTAQLAQAMFEEGE